LARAWTNNVGNNGATQMSGAFLWPARLCTWFSRVSTRLYRAQWKLIFGLGLGLGLSLGLTSSAVWIPAKRRRIGKIPSFSDSAHRICPDSPFPASLTQKFFIMPLRWDVPKEKTLSSISLEAAFFAIPDVGFEKFAHIRIQRVETRRLAKEFFENIKNFKKSIFSIGGLNSRQNDVEFEKFAHIRIQDDETRRLVKKVFENIKKLKNQFFSWGDLLKWNTVIRL
jgi:hypothetical protein